MASRDGDAFERVEQALRRAGSKRNAAGDWTCPAHADRNPSLSLNRGDCGAVLHCHAGCDKSAVVAALGITLHDLFDDQGEKAVKRRVATTHDYLNAEGELLFQVVRFAPKDFRQRRPNGNGTWVWNLKGVDRVLYRLPELLTGVRTNQIVYVVEGEKDADALAAVGQVATTNVGGAGKWRPEYAAFFQGATVIIVQDRDEPGRKHAREVAKALGGVAASVRIVEPVVEAEKADASDHLAAGYSIEDFANVQEGEETEADFARALAATEPPWPAPLDEAAYYGLVGDIVRYLEPNSEADPAALMIQLLAYVGATIGDGPYFQVEADRHPARLFAVLVGETAKGRKGTSEGVIRRVLHLADRNVPRKSGLSSGEGLIWQVRDPIYKKSGAPPEDPGIKDKRLVVIESEFSNVLRVVGRDGNTLSPVIRDAWDRGDLSTLTKNSPAKATGAHISITGHITRDELRRDLDRTDAASGFGNRFLWCCVRRSKVLPEGGNLDEASLQDIARNLSRVIDCVCRHPGRWIRDEEARALWRERYPRLSDGRPGLLGAVTSRAEAQVVRLSLLYALLDAVEGGERYIERAHLEAALAVWRYCEDSAAHIFGDSIGNLQADRALALLRNAGEKGLSRTDLGVQLLGRQHHTAKKLAAALRPLLDHGLARHEKMQTPGRSAERWFAA